MNFSVRGQAAQTQGSNFPVDLSFYGEWPLPLFEELRGGGQTRVKLQTRCASPIETAAVRFLQQLDY